MFRKPAITGWLNQLPESAVDFVPDSTTPEMTVDVYHGALSCLRYQVGQVLETLDHEEAKYRKIGVDYHVIPRILRVTPSLVFLRTVNPSIIHRLMQVYETSDIRTKQPFFRQWHIVASLAELILSKIRPAMHSTDIDHLIFTHDECEQLLKKAMGTVHEVQASVRGMSNMVSDVSERILWSGAMGWTKWFGPNVNFPYGIDGMVFRNWLSTLPENAYGNHSERMDLVEKTVDSYMMCGQVKQESWWTNMANMGDDDNAEGMRVEDTARLGELWLAARENAHDNWRWV